MAITVTSYESNMSQYRGRGAKSSNGKGGVFGDVHSTNQATDLEYLIKKIEDYRRQGLMKDVEKACEQARGDVRGWIETQHPKVAFHSKRYPEGIDLIKDNYNNKTHHQAVLGHFEIISSVVNANIYANYYQRFANTGVRGGEPHTTWWKDNQNAMQEKFAKILDEKLDNLLNNRS